MQTATRELYRELKRNPTSYLRAVLEVTRVHADSPAATLGIREGDSVIPPKESTTRRTGWSTTRRTGR